MKNEISKLLLLCITFFLTSILAFSQNNSHTILWAGSPGLEEAALNGAGTGKYQYIALRHDRYAAIPQLRALNPQAKILMIVHASAAYKLTPCTDPTHLPSGLGYCDVDNNHPDWFLHRKDNNERLEMTTNWHTLDIGNSAYQQAWLNYVLSHLNDHNFDGVMMTDVNPAPFFGMDDNIKEYTVSEFGTAMVDFLSSVSPALRNQGKMVAASGGINPWDNSQVNTITAMLPYLDLLQREHWVKYDNSSTNVFTEQNWLDYVNFAEMVQQAGVAFAGMTGAAHTDEAAQRYIRASWLLTQQADLGGGVAFRAKCNNDCDYWTANWTTTVGIPVSDRIAEGVGWKRQFTDGIVIVNPSATSSQLFKLGNELYYDQDGKYRLEMKLAPGTAAILTTFKTSNSHASFLEWNAYEPAYEGAGAGKYDFIIIGHHPTANSDVQQVRAANPNAVVMMATNGAGSYGAGLEHFAGGVDPGTAPEDYFIHDKNNPSERLYFQDWTYILAMNIGNPDYQVEWTNNVIEHALTHGFDGVWVDDVNVRAAHGIEERMVEYPADNTTEAYYLAYQSFLDYMIPRMHDAGLLVAGNLGIAEIWKDLQYQRGLAMAAKLDIINREHWMRWKPDRFHTEPEVSNVTGPWLKTIEYMERVQEMGKLFHAFSIYYNSNDQIDTPQYWRYMRAGWLMGWDGKSASSMFYHEDSSNPVDHDTWFEDWNIQIGTPTEPRTQLATGAWKRAYSDGLVIVNSHHTQQHFFNLGGEYIDEDGNVHTTVTLPPEHAMVLRSTQTALANEVIQLNGQSEANTIQLKWQLKLSDQVESYQLQHRQAGQPFSTLATFQQEQAMRFTHKNPSAGIHYYRLQISDEAQLAKTSNTLVVYYGGDQADVQLIPNPTYDQFTINVGKGNFKNVPLRLLTTAGQVVYQRKVQITAGQTSVNITNLPPGLYYVELSIDGTPKMGTIMKK